MTNGVMPPSHGDGKIIDYRLTLLESSLSGQEKLSKDNNDRLIKLETEVENMQKTLGDKIDGISKILFWLTTTVLGAVILAVVQFAMRGGLKP